MIKSRSRRTAPSAIPVRTLLTGLGAGRVLVGIGGLAQPAQLARSLGVDRTTAERTAWLARMFAVRDLALGLGLLDALRSKGDPSGWIRLGIVCDAVDALAAGAAVIGGLNAR